MPRMQTITEWKQKAEIDYFSLFIPLWLAFDLWCKDKYGHSTQRNCIEALKIDEINNSTYQNLKDFLMGTDAISETFKDYLAQLNQALLATPFRYDRNRSKTVSFENGLIQRNSIPNNDVYENLIRTKGQQHKIELISGMFISDDMSKVYRSYIEILYQVRCKLLHGDLAPEKENERMIKYLYLTLKELMRDI